MSAYAYQEAVSLVLASPAGEMPAPPINLGALTGVKGLNKVPQAMKRCPPVPRA
jgi:hypothetical protein